MRTERHLAPNIDRLCYDIGSLCHPARSRKVRSPMHAGVLIDCLGERHYPSPDQPRRTGRMSPVELLPGTLDLLILKALSLGPQHGYGVLLRIEQISRGHLPVQQGTLYPALYRLENRGLLETEWGVSENNRRAKYYS